MKLFFIIFSIISFCFSQVRPYQEPYGALYHDMNLNDNIVKVDDKISINYRHEAAASVFPNGILYRLSLKFEGVKQGYLSIQDWNVPEGVVKQNLCKETCCLKTDWCESYSEYFLEENIPTDKCEEYSNPLLRFK